MNRGRRLLDRIFYFLAVILVVFIGWSLRMRAADQLPIDYDEDDYLRAAQLMAVEIQDKDWSGLTATNYRPEHPPLAKLGYGVAIASFPEAPLVPDVGTNEPPAASLPEPQFTRARETASLLGTLEVLLLALINPLAGLFLGIHTFTIKYHSQIMLEALPALTSALAVWSYAQARKKDQAPRFSIWLVLSALFLGMTASGKYLYAVIGFVILIDWLLLAYQHKNWRTVGLALVWGVLAIGFFFASNPYLWPNPVERLMESVSFHSGYATGAAEVQSAGFPLWQSFVWLFGSVPWHPGVFQVSFDLGITLFAFLGLRKLWQTERIYALWIIVMLVFLLVWPTKWPQYILALTFPWSLAAAYGFKEVVWDPVVSWYQRRSHRDKRVVRYKNQKQAFLWLLPGLIVIVAITFYPLLFQTGMALTDFSVGSIRDGLNGGITQAVWQGLTGQVEAMDVNFSRFNPNQEVNFVGSSLLNAVFSFSPDLLFFDVMWTVLVVCLQLGLGIGVALLLHQKGVRLKQFWMVLFILPWAIPEFVGALSWLQILHPSNGWFALSGGTFGQTPGNPFAAAVATWQNSPEVALLVLLVVGVWMGFPVMMLATTAGLKMMPKEVYDAAAMDGASGWALFRRITWPMVLPLLVPVIILRAIFAFNQFYLFFVLSPPDNMYTMSTISYFVFSEWSFYSFSAAINVFTVLVLIAMLLIFNRASKAEEGVSYV